MRQILRFLVAALGLVLAAPLSAHHSFAAFDRSREMEISGTVKEFQWTNPHTWLIVTVLKEGGTTVDYAFQGYNPAELPRMGITRNKFKPGDKVTVKFFPRKDDANGGQMVGVRFTAEQPPATATSK
jgi:Family of unknown function (DUF6152)